MKKEKIPAPAHSTWKSMLDAVPCRNEAAEAAPDGASMVELAVKKKKPFFLVWPITLLIRPNLKKRVVLDKIGTEIWSMCDGALTVENIIDRFSKKYSLSFHESRVAVTDYIRSLVRRGILAMALK